jgi:lysophospholipase L1-like esterase
MPLGDSITHGNGYDSGGGYRGYLWNALLTVQPIGTSTLDPPAGEPGKDHQEGHPGATLEVMAAGLPGWLATTGPADAILLHGGTNTAADVVADAAAIGTIYQAMIAANPAAILFVASPIIRIQNHPELVALQDGQAAAIAHQVTLMPRAIAVPMPPLGPAEMTDEFHPNAAGYLRMSNAWEAALRAAGAR